MSIYITYYVPVSYYVHILRDTVSAGLRFACPTPKKDVYDLGLGLWLGYTKEFGVWAHPHIKI